MEAGYSGVVGGAEPQVKRQQWMVVGVEMGGPPLPIVRSVISEGLHASPPLRPHDLCLPCTLIVITEPHLQSHLLSEALPAGWYPPLDSAHILS